VEVGDGMSKQYYTKVKHTCDNPKREWFEYEPSDISERYEKLRKALEQITLESTKLEVYSIALQALEGE